MKLDTLKQILASFKSVLVAYSGGVDSTFLLKVAQDVLYDNIAAVTVSSPLIPACELDDAAAMTKKLSARHFLVPVDLLSIAAVSENRPDRCYWCKKEIFRNLIAFAEEQNLASVIDGTNHDDTEDYRPGLKALRELGIRSPLQESGLTKNDIRILSKEMDIPAWNKPSCACLASRFPYGTGISEKTLKQVACAEGFLKNLGFSQVRVRHHNDLARIEILRQEMHALLDEKTMNDIITFFNKTGYTYVTIDLDGYRTGSMNEVLNDLKQTPLS